MKKDVKEKGLEELCKIVEKAMGRTRKHRCRKCGHIEEHYFPIYPIIKLVYPEIETLTTNHVIEKIEGIIDKCIRYDATATGHYEDGIFIEIVELKEKLKNLEADYERRK